MIKITFENGKVCEFEKPVTGIEIAKSLGMGIYKSACAISKDGKILDLRETIDSDCKVQILTFENSGKSIFWHSASHILAQAVKRLFPNAKLAIGPAIENGFYYDFDVDENFTVEDLDKIKLEMKKIVKEKLDIERIELSADEAIKLMQERNEPYKIELIKELAKKGEKITLYKQGEFIDLCAGLHVLNTGMIKAFELLNCTGAYWKGDSKSKMLNRIYGVAFPKASLLEEHLKKLEEAKKRDHNKIGRELGFFTTVDYIGQGLPIMLEKGSKVIQLLQRFIEDEEEKRGYILTKTPFLAKRDLYKISGHWDHYRDGMFILGDPDDEKNEVFALRPMTCPFQFQVYLNKPRSYRDLPMRLNETSTLFRNEASGEMHGLIRVRQFTISEGHIACTPDQLEQEFKGCVDLAKYVLKTLGLEEDVTYRFSKWDENNKEKYIGDAKSWEKVQAKMKNILDDLNITYEEVDGDAAFYGPKLDIQMKNVYGKEDTIVTVQIDFQLAERFGMTYTDENNEKKYPYVLHRTSLGCYERTLALLIEKYAGAMPLWLSPEQVRILPISEKYLKEAKKVTKCLKEIGIRAKIDDRNEKTGYKIRSAQMEKIPYMLIIGEKEKLNNTVSVRARKLGDLGALPLQDFINKIKEEIDSKTLDV